MEKQNDGFSDFFKIMKLSGRIALGGGAAVMAVPVADKIISNVSASTLEALRGIGR